MLQKRNINILRMPQKCLHCWDLEKVLRQFLKLRNTLLKVHSTGFEFLPNLWNSTQSHTCQIAVQWLHAPFYSICPVPSSNGRFFLIVQSSSSIMYFNFKYHTIFWSTKLSWGRESEQWPSRAPYKRMPDNAPHWAKIFFWWTAGGVRGHGQTDGSGHGKKAQEKLWRWEPRWKLKTEFRKSRNFIAWEAEMHQVHGNGCNRWNLESAIMLLVLRRFFFSLAFDQFFETFKKETSARLVNAFWFAEQSCGLQAHDNSRATWPN